MFLFENMPITQFTKTYHPQEIGLHCTILKYLYKRGWAECKSMQNLCFLDSKSNVINIQEAKVVFLFELLRLEEVDRRRPLISFPQDNNFAVAGEWTCSSSFCLLHPDNLPTVSPIQLKNSDSPP